MRGLTVTDALLGPALTEDAAAPLVTHYDDDAGTRVELSRATVANWAAKTANWLRDELAVQPGDPVAVRLPAHWQTVGVLLGAWWCGAVVTDDPDGALVALGPPDGLSGLDGADEVAAVSLDPLGAGVGDLPPGVRDHASEVRVHGDVFSPAPLTPALAAATAELVSAARARAAALGLAPGDRVLCAGGGDDLLLPVLAARAALVLCTDAVPADLTRRCEQERVTATQGVTIPGTRRLP